MGIESERIEQELFTQRKRLLEQSFFFIYSVSVSI